MSPTTLRPGARALGALLTAVVLVGAPSAALADDATPTPTASGSPSPSATDASTPTPSATPTQTPGDEPTPSATVTPAPTATAPAPARPATTAPVRAQVLPGPAEPETQAASDFIARTLAQYGDHYVYPDGAGALDPSGYPDHGNTIDAMIALTAAGAHPDQVARSLAWLESTVGSYTGADFGASYVGATAKALIGVVVAGGDPRDVDGTDLVAQLEALRTPTGRFSDTGGDDYTITLTQALALLALDRAGRPVTTPSIELLLDQQCGDGGFRSAIGGTTCVSDPDATAFAAQALLSLDDTLLCWGDVDGTRAAAAAGAERALDHLAAAQDASGGLESADGILSANTAGVAGQAFLADGRSAEAADAAAFVATLQYGPTAPAALRGGIAKSDGDRSTTVPADTDLRATPQAALLLAGGDLLDTLAEGSEPAPPATVCPAQPTSTPTTTPTSGTDPSTTAPAGDGGSTPSTPVAAAPAGALAQTGTDPLLPVLLGFALVLLGAVAVVASRRRGAHA
ncbi:hypothetical protein [Phycicoccus sonneratiae]|uniref:Uncharacterized protein n=1 Tax=Phycicoccus sonneratiae TaxID=2807628 RepID=A0ABS2CGP7_9MICO|nr:hypothetical protein [Phycicoccus sonneraticus]MBM6399038.1 hypothetical protein [Phycicoccus sonneraticus]